MVFDRFFGGDEHRAETLKQRAASVLHQGETETLEELVELSEHDDADVRRPAAVGLAEALSELDRVDAGTPADLPVGERALRSAVARLAAFLDGPDDVALVAAQALGTVERAMPDLVAPHGDALLDAVEGSADDPAASARAALQGLLDARPAAVTPAMLDADHEGVRAEAAEAYATAARTAPDRIDPAPLLDALERERAVADPAATALRRLHRTRPDAVREAVGGDGAAALPDDLRESLDGTADADESVASLADRLREAEADGRRRAIERLASLAETAPSEAARARPAIRDALDDDAAAVRATACRTLGLLGDDAARDRIAELRVDPDPAVSDAARAAVDRIGTTDPVEPASAPAPSDADDRSAAGPIERADDGWPMAGATPARTGITRATPPADAPAVRWRYDAGDGAVVATATAADLVVVASADGDALSALDADTGRERWTRDVEGAVLAGVAVADGSVFACSGITDEHGALTHDGAIHALDAASGRPEWSFDAEPCFAPAVRDGAVYAGGVDLYAVDAGTGVERWRHADAGSVTGLLAPNAAKPAVHDGTVYVAGTGVRALSARSGEQSWSLDPGAAATTPPVLGRTALYVGLEDGTVRSLDRETGDENWRHWIGETPTASAFDGRTLYVGSADAGVHAVGVEPPRERWVHEGGEQRWPPVVADGTVLRSEGDGVTALDAETGATRWSVDLETRPTMPSPVDGGFCVGTTAGTVYAFES